jgi:hypothetical protein
MWCRKTDFDLGSGFAVGGSHLNYTSPTYSLQTALGLSAVLFCACELVLLSSTVICLQQYIFNYTLVTKQTYNKGQPMERGVTALTILILVINQLYAQNLVL